MKGIRLGLKALRSGSDKTNSAALPAQSVTDNLVTVYLRIEGEDSTIFEGSITTSGHDVTLPNGKTYPADGNTNTKRKLKASYPTPIAALDDAAHLEGFTWDGKYFAEYGGIFITRIADTEQDKDRFWGILSNYQYTKVGGCHHRLEAGDDILFAFDAFRKKHFLKLSGPVSTTVGVPIRVTVVDGQASDAPMSDVFVGGQKTDINGHATVIFRSPGIHNLKAKRSADCIRSNVLGVTVSR